MTIIQNSGLLNNSPPIIVGGLGGSGTRLIAQCLQTLGFFMGEHLNHAQDNLYFGLLFKRQDILRLSKPEFSELVAIFYNATFKLQAFDQQQLALIQAALALKPNRPQLQRIVKLLTTQTYAAREYPLWGWKAPNTHLVLARLNQAIPQMQYIYVARNGLDMAYSNNTKQLELWGELFFPQGYQITPYYQLKYWCLAYQRLLQQAATMQNRVMILNYDDFCANPSAGLKQLATFVGYSITATQQQQLLQLITVSKSTNRFHQYDLTTLDPADIQLVKKFGFQIN